MVRLIVAVIIIAAVVMLFSKASGVSGGTWGVTGPPIGSSGAGMKTGGGW